MIILKYFSVCFTKESEMGYKVKIGLSNKHVHLCREHLDILFGEGHELTPIKDLGQPGQYAQRDRKRSCRERV